MLLDMGGANGVNKVHGRKCWFLIRTNACIGIRMQSGNVDSRSESILLPRYIEGE